MSTDPARIALNCPTEPCRLEIVTPPARFTIGLSMKRAGPSEEVPDAPLNELDRLTCGSMFAPISWRIIPDAAAPASAPEPVKMICPPGRSGMETLPTIR